MTAIAPVAPAVVDAAPAAPVIVETPAVQTKYEVLQNLKAPAPFPVDTPTDTVPAPTAEAVIPEGEAAPEVESAPVVEAPVQESLRYRKRAADGTYLQPDNAAKIEFEIAGKPYAKTEAELVRGFARSVEASRIQNENHDFRERVIPELTQRHQSEVQQLQQAKQELAALQLEVMQALDQEDIPRLTAYRDQWRQMNSPEHRLQQTQAELVSERQAAQHHQALQRATQIAGALKAYAQPIQDKLVQDHADVLGGEEFLRDTMQGRLNKFTRTLSGSPEQRAQQVAEYVHGPLSQWVTERATHMRTQNSAANDAKQKAEQDAQRARQAQRNTEARSFVPLGTTPSGQSPAPRTGPPGKQQVLADLRNGVTRR